MTRAILKGNVTSINIADIKEDLKKAIEKGYSIKQLLKLGITFVNTSDENIKNVLEISENIKEAKNLLDNFKKILELINLYYPLVNECVRKVEYLQSTVERINDSIRYLSEKYEELMKKYEESMEMYRNILANINNEINKTLEDYKIEKIDEITNLINKIDECRKSIVSIYKIPPLDKFNEEMASSLAKIRKIISKSK